MARIFGTDGVRGLANRDVTPELALGLGVAAAHVLASHRGEDEDISAPHPGHLTAHDDRPLALIGRDSRASGEFLSAALAAGMASAGADVVDVGVLPTPAIAHLTAVRRADVGVVVSASHNPMADNGIKFLARGGHKLADSVEDEIAARMADPWQRPIGPDVGRLARDAGGAGHEYVEHLLASTNTSLKGLRIVVDCANGAASQVGPETLRAAGADVVAINARPTAATSTRSAAPPTPSSCRPRWWPPAPISGSPSTATPIVASPWTAPVPSWTATRSWG